MSLAKDYKGAKGVDIGGLFCPCCSDRTRSGKKTMRRANRRKARQAVRKDMYAGE